MLEKHSAETLERLQLFNDFWISGAADKAISVARQFLAVGDGLKNHNYHSYVEKVLKRNSRSLKVAKSLMGKLFMHENEVTRDRTYLAPTMRDVPLREGGTMPYDHLGQLVSIRSSVFGMGRDHDRRLKTRLNISKFGVTNFLPEERHEGKVADMRSFHSMMRVQLASDHFIQRFSDRVGGDPTVALFRHMERQYAEFITDCGVWAGREKQYVVLRHMKTETLIEVFHVEGLGCVYFFGFGTYNFSPPTPIGEINGIGGMHVVRSIILTCMAEADLEDWKRAELAGMYMTSDTWLSGGSYEEMLSRAVKRGWGMTMPMRVVNYGSAAGRK